MSPIPPWKVIGNYAILKERWGRRGSQKPNFLKESMKLNWKFQMVRGGRRGSNQIIFHPGEGVFSLRHFLEGLH